jgi:hypothetical protein
METFDEDALKFKIPAGMVIAGPSSSGKSTLMMKLMRHANEMFEPRPAEIVYAYGQYHKFIPKLQSEGITTHPGLPSEEFLNARRRPLLLVMDDLMMSASDNYLTDLYTKKNHHQQIFSCFLSQNLYDKHLRVARNNSQYIILTRAPNALLSIRTLGSQLFPKQLNYFIDAYNQATKENYGYIVLDLHPASSQQLRIRTNIFPDEKRVIFLPQNA